MMYFPNSDVAAASAGPAATPQLQFTLEQVGRLWGWPAPQCRELIGKLVERGYMAQSPDGLYYMVRGLRRARQDERRPCAS